MDIDEEPRREDDGGRDSGGGDDERYNSDERYDEGGRETQDDSMMMGYEAVRGARADAAARSISPEPLPWYMPSFFAPHAGPRPMPSTGRAVGGGSSNRNNNNIQSDVDVREESMTVERESGDRNHLHYDSRIHEPLKRDDRGLVSDDSEDEDGGRPKRRRIVSDAAAVSFYNALPRLTEQQQAIVEYTAPSTFTPLFRFLGYTPFAVKWVMVMYACHFVQTLLTGFGDDSANVRLRPWIPPLIHHLMDTYIWNHSMITLMLLYPDWFSTPLTTGMGAYSMAVFFTMAQQQFYLAFSLQTHYHRSQHLIQHPAYRREIELSFVNIFLLYGFADVCFILARMFSWPYLLYFGLIEFNLCPIYLVWHHKRLMDAGILASKTTGAAATAAAVVKDATKKEAKKEK